MHRPLIAVFGTGGGSDEDLARARSLGRRLAESGFGVLNGGYGGTMEETAVGAREAGGRAVGVTCAEFTFRAGPNPHLDEVVEAPTLFSRVETLVRRAAGYVVLPGGNGTLIELGLTWEYQRRGLLPGRPIAVWERPWRRIIETLAADSYVREGLDKLTWVDDVEGAVAAVSAAARAAARPDQEPPSDSGTSRSG